ncbi:MAG TPA: ATPase, T2SS/T4P/T4SS family [Kiritimatiellia bacterium]|nr:ATPase, T2SS/T4P/T4SS family [Kiritimatiellia bacterium]HRZ13019.1 ATPase, T2SS/T4P/T4SS family [Kiritimatiellia bacterium]HSA18371.1 ATPase, T2SS/T4P/T4SS family [Kiritimatiellia bacterium]
MRLDEVLVGRGRVTPEQVEEARARAGKAGGDVELGRALVDAGLLADADLLDALGELYGCDVLREPADNLLDPELVAQLPVEWARAHAMLPVRQGARVVVLTSDPSDLGALDDLALILGTEPAPLLASRREILAAIEHCYVRKTDSPGDLLRGMKPAAGDTPERPADDLLRTSEQAPVTQLINLILLEALKARASDVHLEPYASHLRLRYRIDGMLYEQSSPPKHLEAPLVSRLKVMARLDIAEKRLPQDGTARVRVGEQEVDIRVSTIPVAEGERVVLRLLNRESTVLPLSKLGMPDSLLARFRELVAQPNGVILVTGPTGSGKTTTLYAALQELDKAHANILTIEDPIEYQLPHIGQIQVKPKIGLTFASGLRHILRQDPDVILVGEIRDVETAEIAVRASLTGHLVFSTLHTNDAVSAVIRMADMGVESYLLAAALRAALAQRLVRRLCPHCRRPAVMTDEQARALGSRGGEWVGSPVWQPGECSRCRGGYHGRLGVFELMLVDSAVQEAVRAGRPLGEIRELAARQGMRALHDDALDKIRSGETSVAEVLRAVGRHDVRGAAG